MSKVNLAVKLPVVTVWRVGGGYSKSFYIERLYPKFKTVTLFNTFLTGKI